MGPSKPAFATKIFLCSLVLQPQPVNKIARGEPRCHESVSVDNGRAAEAKTLSVTARIQQLSLCCPGWRCGCVAGMLAPTSQLWHWQPVAFTGAGMVLPFFPCGCKLPFSNGNQNFSSPGPALSQGMTFCGSAESDLLFFLSFFFISAPLNCLRRALLTTCHLMWINP